MINTSEWESNPHPCKSKVLNNIYMGILNIRENIINMLCLDDRFSRSTTNKVYSIKKNMTR